MTDFFTMLIIALGVILVANIAFFFINAHMYKVWIRAMRIKLNTPQLKVKIPTGMPVRIEKIELVDGLPHMVSKVGLVIWSAGNELTVEDHDNKKYHVTINEVTPLFEGE